MMKRPFGGGGGAADTVKMSNMKPSMSPGPRAASPMPAPIRVAPPQMGNMPAPVRAAPGKLAPQMGNMPAPAEMPVQMGNMPAQVGGGMGQRTATPPIISTAPNAMKCGGKVKKMASGGKVKRGCGIAKKGYGKGKMR